MQHPVLSKTARTRTYQEPVKRLPRPEKKEEQTKGLVMRIEVRR